MLISRVQGRQHLREEIWAGPRDSVILDTLWCMSRDPALLLGVIHSFLPVNRGLLAGGKVLGVGGRCGEP